MKTQKYISRCIASKSTKGVIKELEEELIDVGSVKSYLLRDLSLVGLRVESREIVIEKTQIRVILKSLTESSILDLTCLLDVYARTYPELDFVFTTKAG